eukprot:Blabericola_migrator_1__10271@NODE_5757_length_681_cov_249_120521_g3774_i0_p1_GENE_NODE_5757_length_681_cov_249_120521_g3774_i0NODE_5757_length_681_cov_249_120521_g3774_i0_p1_ORF_typecomplete_len116_score26_22_NODE_5757_length_681_cov_249_120521_g3774_i0118465
MASLDTAQLSCTDFPSTERQSVVHMVAIAVQPVSERGKTHCKGCVRGRSLLFFHTPSCLPGCVSHPTPCIRILRAFLYDEKRCVAAVLLEKKRQKRAETASKSASKTKKKVAKKH